MFHLWPRLRLLHGRPRRAQHHIRLPRGHYPPLSHHAEGQTQHRQDHCRDPPPLWCHPSLQTDLLV